MECRRERKAQNVIKRNNSSRRGKMSSRKGRQLRRNKSPRKGKQVRSKEGKKSPVRQR